MIKFFKKTLWTIKLSEQPFLTRKFLNALRIIVLTSRSFLRNQCLLKASALTFYTLLSVVPVAALAFAVAKGFSLEGFLKDWLMNVLKDQPVAGEKIIDFAQKTLEGAKGGVIAGVGAVILLYTTLRLLFQVESSFNEIWGVRTGRTFVRKMSDYLALILFFPLIAILSGSVTAFAFARVNDIVRQTELLNMTPEVHLTMLIVGRLVPFVAAWFLFAFLYLFIPNTKVKFSAAVVGGFLAGLLYYFVQWGYIFLQFIVAKYNAIYGGFAALPLFLLWLQVSWTIILLGAETAFSFQNVSSYEGDPADMNPPPIRRIFCILKIARLCSVNFNAGGLPLSDMEISHRLEIPILLTRRSLHDLTDAGILVQVLNVDGSTAYQVAMPVERLTPVSVCRAIVWNAPACENVYDPLDQQLNHIWEAAAKSISNQPLYKMEMK